MWSNNRLVCFFYSVYIQCCLHCLHAMLSPLFTCNVVSIVYMHCCLHCLHALLSPLFTYSVVSIVNIQHCLLCYKHSTVATYTYHLVKEQFLWISSRHVLPSRVYNRLHTSSSSSSSPEWQLVLWWHFKGKNCGYKLREQLYGLSHMELWHSWSHLASQYWFLNSPCKLNLQVVSSTLGESQETLC